MRRRKHSRTRTHPNAQYTHNGQAETHTCGEESEDAGGVVPRAVTEFLAAKDRDEPEAGVGLALGIERAGFRKRHVSTHGSGKVRKGVSSTLRGIACGAFWCA